MPGVEYKIMPNKSAIISQVKTTSAIFVPRHEEHLGVTLLSLNVKLLQQPPHQIVRVAKRQLALSLCRVATLKQSRLASSLRAHT